MTLAGRLQDDLKAAMRAGDVLTRDTLRMLLADLKNMRIELGRDLDEGEELAVVTKARKRREESAEQYDEAGRADLAERERSEIEICRRYLPQALSEAETRALVEGAIQSQGLSSKRDLGALMKSVLSEHRGRVDGKLVQRIAAELLA